MSHRVLYVFAINLIMIQIWNKKTAKNVVIINLKFFILNSLFILFLI